MLPEDKLLTFGGAILTLVGLMFGVYWTFVRNRADSTDRQLKTLFAANDSLLLMIENRRKVHDAEIADIRERHAADAAEWKESHRACLDRERAAAAREVTADALAVKQGKEIDRLTDQVRELSRRLDLPPA